MLFSEGDFISVDSFSLAWRWTDTKHWKASESDLDEIRPLAEAAANRLWDELDQGILEKIDRRTFFDADALEFDTTGEPSETSIWLDSVLPAQRGQIIIFWECNKAVVTEANLFVRHWDGFCYPASDDVIIWSMDFDWVLHYDHEELFHFKRMRLP